MTEVVGLGARLARYRRRLGFHSTAALAAHTGGRVSEAVLQNIESGRKADISVAQLLEISWALGISPLLLLAPLDSPNAHLDLAGIGDGLSAMTSAAFDAWVRGTGPVTIGRAPALLLRAEIDQVRALVRELNDWHSAELARRHHELMDATTHHSSAFTDADRLAHLQRQQRIDQLCDDLADRTDLTWVDRPWHPRPAAKAAED